LTSGTAEIADYEAQAREFLAKSREYLDQGELHQASEKGWGAAAHMAKAVAQAQGWKYDTHPDFSEVMYQARLATGNASLGGLRSIANELHFNYYRRKRHLNPDAIREDLERIAELLDILHPLTGLDPSA
jgi:uncharacterized protein (UPF0332 family)